MKRVVRSSLLILLVALIATFLFACDLGGDKKDNNDVKVDDMAVVGEIEGSVYYDPDIDKICWGNVTDAKSYIVKFGKDDSERTFGSNEAGFTSFTGDDVFYVYAVRNDNTKTAVKSQAFTKAKLDLHIDKENDAAAWTSNDSVTKYHVTVKNKDDKNAEPVKWDENAGATNASLECVPDGDCRYTVTVETEVGIGTVLPDSDYIDNVRRVRNKDAFYYYGGTGSFLGLPHPIPGEQATYTHHFTINGEKHDVVGSTTYAYTPTGGTFTASVYTESNRANYLNSFTRTITGSPPAGA